MSGRKSIFVLMGGRSPEHEISLLSGREVVRNLDHNKYNIYPVLISKDGERWQLTSRESLDLISDPIKYKGTNRDVKLFDKKVFNNIKSISGRPDLVFIALHGPFGEDGTIQGLLDFTGLKYTGSGVLASALGMDKIMFKKVMLEEGIEVPKWVGLSRGEALGIIKKNIGNPPYFVKPSNQGSSVGTAMVKGRKTLEHALNVAWNYSTNALVEEYINGTELTCAVLGNDKPFALPVIEIIPKRADYFDYESKYIEGGSDEIVPARISGKMTKIIQNIALKVHLALGCRGFSRVDFIMRNGESPLVLEINTIPGLTPMSLLPKAAETYGITYTKLLDKIISYALE